MTLNTIEFAGLPNGGQVFKKQGVEGFFWNDFMAPTVDYGPFHSVYDAMRHYRDALKERKAIKLNMKKCPVINMVLRKSAVIIHVDFKARKRIK